MLRTEFAIIGAGPGGYVAALRAAQLGTQVILIEKKWLGGVCLNAGCIPTKALIRSADVTTLVENASEYGIKVNQPVIDWQKVQNRKERVVNQLVSGVQMLLKRAGVTVIDGEARFVSADTLEVKSRAGLQKVVADHIVIATGSRSATIPVPGVDLPGVINSTGALSLEELPESILIVGGGAIGLEWASMFSDFGAQVKIVEMMPKLAPLMDDDLGEALTFNLEKRGVEVMTNSAVVRVAEKRGVLRTTVKTPKGEIAVESEKVLLAVGRLPNAESLDLKKANVDDGPDGIVVDRRMRTTAPGVYAVGDVAAEGPMLAHVASHQGIVAVEDAMGHEVSMDYHAVPSCIFTRPETASVGMSEQEARQEGRSVKVGKFGLANNGKAIANGETEGFVKIVAGEKENEILGVHVFGPHASDLILEGTLSIRLDATLDEIEAAIHPHPTLGEAVHEAALAASGRALHLPKS